MLKLCMPSSNFRSGIASSSGRPAISSSSTGCLRTTHAGVLEFSSPEGVVALPHKVRECLWGPGQSAHGSVEVRVGLRWGGGWVCIVPVLLCACM